MTTCISVSSMRLPAAILSLVLLVGCTKPKETTTMGAVAGGAIGAGLGAIVGSQTGSAGGGLAIGAVAGAGTGALIANALQAQDEKIQRQDEEIIRQREKLDAQGRESEELRRGRTDQARANTPKKSLSKAKESAVADTGARARYNGQSAVTHPAGLTPEQIRMKEAYAKARTLKDSEGKGSVVRTSSTFNSSSRDIEVEHPVVQETKEHRKSVEVKRDGAIASANAATIKKSSTKTTHVIEVDTKPASDATDLMLNPSSRDLDLPADDAAISKEAGSTATLAHKPSQNPAGAVATGSSAAQDAQQDADRAAELARQQKEAFSWKRSAAEESDSTSCGEAQDEVKKSDAVTDSADKLFHLRRALRLCPENAELHVKLGKIYEELKRPKDAAFEYREALALNPGLSTAKQALAATGQE